MSAPRRVMHVTKRYPGAQGGDATLVAGLVAVQRARGDIVSVVTSNCADIVDEPQLHKTGLPIGQEALDRIGVRRVLSLLALLLTSLRLLLRERPDVVHAHAPELGAAFALSTRLLRVPTVLTLHGTAIGSPELPAAKGVLERALVRAGRYDRLLCVDPLALPALAGLAAAPAAFVANAVDPALFVPQEQPPRHPRLLTIGRLEEVKRTDLLVGALAQVRATGRDVGLDVVGAGSLERTLRAQVRATGLDGCVRFHGSCRPQEVRDLLRACTALVIPSIHEGFPMTLLEAWASAVPVITTRVGAAAELCTDRVDALVVPAGDAGALAHAIATLLGDPALAARLARAGRRRVLDDYHYEALSAHLDGVYDGLVAS